MRKVSTFAAASLIAAGLVSFGAAAPASAADAGNPCKPIANAVGAIQLKSVRGTHWVCRGKNGGARNTGNESVSACWAAAGHKVTIVHGSKKTTCSSPGKSLNIATWTSFTVS